jgi:hypothetical protein
MAEAMAPARAAELRSTAATMRAVVETVVEIP